MRNANVAAVGCLKPRLSRLAGLFDSQSDQGSWRNCERRDGPRTWVDIDKDCVEEEDEEEAEKMRTLPSSSLFSFIRVDEQRGGISEKGILAGCQVISTDKCKWRKESAAQYTFFVFSLKYDYYVLCTTVLNEHAHV